VVGFLKPGILHPVSSNAKKAWRERAGAEGGGPDKTTMVGLHERQLMLMQFVRVVNYMLEIVLIKIACNTFYETGTNSKNFTKINPF
jgi:hypothetical protein